MEVAKNYDPNKIESYWYQYWMDKGFFRSVPDEREPYTIVIPPPNVTGVLHMGHMLNNTLQDVLIRRARMLGKNACWVPGTDHASIATEAKVVALLKENGINKKDLSREEFLTHAWEWKEKYGGIILEQLKKLGASCDWERTRFTMEDEMSDAVIDVFIDLFKKGHIYRGHRMVNWDPVGLTAVSDEEVIYKEGQANLYYVKYAIANSQDFITIATTRPETILGDTAICVHPDDPRYKHLVGQQAIVPIANRLVPIIADSYIEMEFGTGALKVTPAHDINDYALGQKHNLQTIDTLTAEGKLSEAAGHYVGEDRFVVRKKIVKDLDELGLLEKTEQISNKVGHSERTNAVIEPRLSLQWFLKMKEISEPALEHVVNGDIQLIPDKFINTYKHWLENVRDWCISRQLWWGQRIPAWYDEQSNFCVCKTEQEAKVLLKSDKVKQDEDVLDTWFSSWLWPISVFDGFKDPTNKDIAYYYPTNDLITAPEILFFWVARMVIAGYEYRKEKPFSNVYLTGIVRDKQGRKMSKSLGNSPDPLDLIGKYGADGVRVGMLLSSPAGNDLLFDESSCEQGRNFANKIWNAFRLIKGWQVEPELQQPAGSKIAGDWFSAKFNAQLIEINQAYDSYRISETLMLTYKLVWDDFCAWYLELIKPAFIEGNAQPIDAKTFQQAIGYFENLLKVLHPFMPFVTEEIWHSIGERNVEDSLMVTQWPKLNEINSDLIASFNLFEAIVAGIRNIRQEKNISPKNQLDLILNNHPSDFVAKWGEALQKLGGLKSINQPGISSQQAARFLAGTTDVVVPIGDFIDIVAEKTKIEKELVYVEGFRESVLKKLGNQGFVSKAAPALIENEKKKLADAESKIKSLNEQLIALNITH